MAKPINNNNYYYPKVPVPRPARDATIVNLVYSAKFEAYKEGKRLITLPVDKLSALQGIFPCKPKPCMPLNAIREILFGHTVRPTASGSGTSSSSSTSSGTGLGFSSVIAHFKNPKSTIHIYHNGEFIICGVNSLEECLYTISRISNYIFKATGGLSGGGIKLEAHGRVLRNVVAAYATGYLLDLEDISKRFGIKCRYAPELYKGLPYYPQFPKKTPCIVFHHTGAVNVVGASSLEEVVHELSTAFMQLLPPPSRTTHHPPPPPPLLLKPPKPYSSYDPKNKDTHKRVSV